MSVVRLWAGGQTYRAVHRHRHLQREGGPPEGPHSTLTAAAAGDDEADAGSGDTLLLADEAEAAALRSSMSSIDMTLVSVDSGDADAYGFNSSGVLGGSAAAAAAVNGSRRDEYATPLPPVFRVGYGCFSEGRTGV